jgi:hypothetical protein
MGGKGCLTNNKQENLAQIQADNVTKRRGVRVNRKKYSLQVFVFQFSKAWAYEKC